MKKIIMIVTWCVLFSSLLVAELTFPIVDTNQSLCYDNLNEIDAPELGDPFYGQDANYTGNAPAYTDNNDGTITDNVTGLMWAKTCDMDGDGDIDYDDKLSYEEAMESAETFDLAGYSDWRLPSIKEQYSMIIFSGIDVSGYEGDTEGLVPFVDTDYFDFGYGDEDAGERIIDAQMATSTLYVGTTMIDDETMFGVNFADGRIKGYPTGPMPGQTEDKQFYVYYVRGNIAYGENDFQNNNDGTITDNATGLMWTQDDSGEGLIWEDALSYADSYEFAGHSDWRLPNAKELQSIVDYTRSLQTTDSPAIDTIFNCTQISDEGDGVNYPFYWSGTTHANMQNGGYGCYVTFGEALGWMEMPPDSGNYTLLDVHGAGAQRSDPKTGDPSDYPYGHGPQGDVIRIFNYVRLVRYADLADAGNEEAPEQGLQLKQNFPNPFNPTTTIEFSVNGENAENVYIGVFNVKGQEVKTLLNETLPSGEHSVVWDGTDNTNTAVASGVYYSRLRTAKKTKARKMIMLK